MVEIHSHTAPYLTFMGEILPNNSYVDLSLVGQGGNATHDSGREIVCHTDLDTCCSGSDGHGDWYFPHGFKLKETTNNRRRLPIAMRRLHKRVRLEHIPGTSGPIPSGIYYCVIDIETVASVSGSGSGMFTSKLQESLYVGIYASGGIIIILLFVNNIWCHKAGLFTI